MLSTICLYTVADTLQLGAGAVASPFSFWSYGRSVLDLLPVLRHFQYQLSPRTQASSAAYKDDSMDATDSPLGTDVCLLFCISPLP